MAIPSPYTILLLLLLFLFHGPLLRLATQETRRSGFSRRKRDASFRQLPDIQQAQDAVCQLPDEQEARLHGYQPRAQEDVSRRLHDRLGPLKNKLARRQLRLRQCLRRQRRGLILGHGSHRACRCWPSHARDALRTAR